MGQTSISVFTYCIHHILYVLRSSEQLGDQESTGIFLGNSPAYEQQYHWRIFSATLEASRPPHMCNTHCNIYTLCMYIHQIYLLKAVAGWRSTGSSKIEGNCHCTIILLSYMI